MSDHQLILSSELKWFNGEYDDSRDSDGGDDDDSDDDDGDDDDDSDDDGDDDDSDADDDSDDADDDDDGSREFVLLKNPSKAFHSRSSSSFFEAFSR